MSVAKELRVRCPSCHVGGAVIAVVRRFDAEQLERVNEPRRCDACGRYFKLQIQMHVVGVPLPTAAPDVAQGDVLRAIVGGDGR